MTSSGKSGLSNSALKNRTVKCIAFGALLPQTFEGIAVDEEVIRELTQAEYEGLRTGFTRGYQVNTKTDTRLSSGALDDAEPAPSQEAMELGLKIWELRKAGYSRLEILQRIKIPLKVIDDCLREFQSRIGMEAGRAMEHYRVLDNERIEDLLKCWLPIATGGPIRIEKIRGGEVFREADFDLPLKASYFVLQAIERRLKIMAASQPEAGKDGHGQTNVAVWLQSVLPSLQKIVQQIDDGDAASAKKSLVRKSEVEKLD
jgi:hypothetical protein